MKIELLKRAATGLVFTMMLSTAYVGVAQASDLLRVFTNHARILKFETPVSRVIVGNSDVADVTVSDPTFCSCILSYLRTTDREHKIEPLNTIFVMFCDRSIKF